MGVVRCPDLVNVYSAVISYDNLFEESPEDLAHAVSGLVIRERASIEELWQEVRSAFNRAGNQLREKRYKRKERDNIFGRFYLLAIDVYRIAEGLESVERYADRKNDVEQMTVCGDTEESSELGDKEVVVFEDCEDAEIQNYVAD